MVCQPVFFIGVVAIWTGLCVQISLAQTTSITSSGLNTRVTTRPNTTIHDITGGTRPGNGTNLFHSFGNFSVGTNNTANFLNETGSLTTNILSRVTGGNPSNIFGTIRTENFGTANLYLINPAGILFGPTASINVGGSFNASTADYIKMANGEKFYANSSPPPLLSFAPAAFGFLGGNPGGTITIQGATLSNGPSLTLVGRDRTNGSTTTPGIALTGGTLNYPGGRINLVSVGAPSDPGNALIGGEVVVSGSDQSTSFTPTGFSNLGTVTISNSNLSVFAERGGTIYARGANVIIDDSRLDAGSFGGGRFVPGVGIVTIGAPIAIDFELTEQLLLRNAAHITTDTGLGGTAGTISVTAKNVTLDGSSVSPEGMGRSETRVIGTDTVIMNNGANIHGFTSVYVSGRTVDVNDSNIGSGFENQSGSIRIEANDLILRGTSNVFTTNAQCVCKNGPIEIQSTNLTLMGEASISSSTAGGFPESDAGDIIVNSKNISLVDSSSITSSSGALAASGSIRLFADSLSVNGQNAEITVTTRSFRATPTVGSIFIRAGEVLLVNGGAVKAEALTSFNDFLGRNTDTSDAGSITANVGSLIMTNGASISTTNTGPPGKAGTITIQGLDGADTQARSVSAAQSSITTEANGGPGGSIKLTASQINLLDSTMSATSKAATTIHPPANVQVRGGNFAMSGGVIAAETGGAATGGNIDINVGNMAFTNGAAIITNSTSDASTAGRAGDIALTSGIDILLRASTLSTTADQASGGNIKLTAPNLVRIVDSTITSSVKGQAGSNGGNINIDPQVVVIQNSNLQANANAGAGGNINIAALGAVLVDPNSLLSATAGPAGVSGSVNISSPIRVLSGALVPMKLAYTQTGLSGDRCAADPKGQFSSFVQTGRDGAPQAPGGFASSPLGFLDTYQTSALDTDRTMTQAARLGLSESLGEMTNTVHFFSACRS